MLFLFRSNSATSCQQTTTAYISTKNRRILSRSSIRTSLFCRISTSQCSIPYCRRIRMRLHLSYHGQSAEQLHVTLKKKKTVLYMPLQKAENFIYSPDFFYFHANNLEFFYLTINFLQPLKRMISTSLRC